MFEAIFDYFRQWDYDLICPLQGVYAVELFLNYCYINLPLVGYLWMLFVRNFGVAHFEIGCRDTFLFLLIEISAHMMAVIAIS